MRMYAHLWTHGPMPEEYVGLVLCERFGWTPSELRQERASDILEILTMMDVEARVRRQRR